MSAEVVLSQDEASALDECELIIETGVRTFVKVGTALLRIRDDRLYRTTHGTFEEYCRDRWGWSASRGRQLIGAAEAAKSVTNVTPDLAGPSNEGQARELVGLEPEQAREVWEEAVEKTDGKPTAKKVREVREQLVSAATQRAAERIAEQTETWSEAAETERRMAEQTAHLNDRVNAERPYALAILAVVDGLEQMPIGEFDPENLAVNCPEHVRYRLDETAKHATWLLAFLSALQSEVAA